jgi:hypothetical protein
MDDEILTIYCLCDEYLRSIGHKDHPQCQMSSAEVTTVAIVAVMNFGGNFALSCRWLHAPQWMPIMLSKSRYSHSLYHVKRHFITLFGILAIGWKTAKDDLILEYVHFSNSCL